MNLRLFQRLPRAILLVAALLPAIAFAETLVGQIVSVHDRDTVTLLDANRRQHKIRLSGVDAPELGQAFGRVSKENLSRQVYGRAVEVEWDKTDRYRRLVGKVIVDGHDANLGQIAAGLAWHYKAYARDQVAIDRERYAAEELRARQAQLGLWQDVQPTPPWLYRWTIQHPRP